MKAAAVGQIIIELTNRCNLACQHCFAGRHGGGDDLPLSVIRDVLAGARDAGFGRLAFTGGEPTTHPEFSAILQMTCGAGYPYGFVTNGWNFLSVCRLLKAMPPPSPVITFSLDGATEATHDQLRGRGSFRRVLRAFAVCVFEGLPFTINTVVSAHNRDEIGKLAQLVGELGSQGLRFGHLVHTPSTSAMGLDLSPAERKEVESRIRQVAREAAIPIAIAPGYYTNDLFPCDPLQMREFNIDCHGNVTKCCHLSGQCGSGAEIVGNLLEIGFAEAVARMRNANEQFRAPKAARHAQGAWQDSDYFPCWYCSVHFGKIGWLAGMRENAWSSLLYRESAAGLVRIEGSS